MSQAVGTMREAAAAQPGIQSRMSLEGAPQRWQRRFSGSRPGWTAIRPQKPPAGVDR